VSQTKPVLKEHISYSTVSRSLFTVNISREFTRKSQLVGQEEGSAGGLLTGMYVINHLTVT
jgi:hypothetical protein